MPVLKIPLRGLRCQACAASVEKGLKSIPWIRNARVDLLTSTATVDYQEKGLDVSQIQEVIRRLGYEIREGPHVL